MLRILSFLHSKTFQAVLATIGIAGVATACATVWVGGIGWDSLFEVRAMTKFTSADGGLTLADFRTIVPEHDVARGVWIFFLAQALAWTSGDAIALDPGLPETYRVLGIASATIVSLGSVIVSLVVWRVTRSSLSGVMTFALLFTTPLWVGFAGVAWRDAPIAVGITLVSSGIALMMSQDVSRRAAVVALCITALGTFIAVGSRAGAVALVVALCVLALLPMLWPRVRYGRPAVRNLSGVLLGVVTGTVAAVIVNPVARLDPWDWLVQSVLTSPSNPAVFLVKVAAQDVLSDDLPLWYIPAYLLAQLPLATLIALAASLLLLFVVALQRWRYRHSCSMHGGLSVVISWPFIVQGVALPIVITVVGSNIYDGLRHVLFVVPALIVVIAMAIALAPTDRWSATLGLLAAAAVLLGGWATLRWFPYSYAHLNPVAGAVKEPRIWELDFWGLSAREGVTRLRDLGAEIVYVSPTANTSLPWGASEPPVRPGVDSSETFGWYVFERWAADIPQECQVEFEIRRDGHLLGRGGLCRAEGVK